MNIKTFFVFLGLLFFMFFGFYTVFERTYSIKVEGVENFVAPKVDTSSFNISNYESCPTDLSYDVYKLQERYFKDSQNLVVRVALHYFPNNLTTNITRETFKSRVDMMNDFFRGSGAKLEFSLDTVIVHYGEPIANPKLKTSINSFESFLGKERDDLRYKYYGQHVDFHNNILHLPKYLNIFVYNDDTNFTGRAGDIESTYFGINLKYMHPELYTFEHEAGHCYGLYHTHTFDNSGNPHSTDGGDFVCDTYPTFPLNTIVDDSCKLIRDWQKNLKIPPYTNPISSWKDITEQDVETLIKNVMSYTRHQCRQEFTNGQVKRMRKILENNRDLRETIEGLDKDLKNNILKNLSEIK